MNLSISNMKKIILFLATILAVSAGCESTTKSTIVEPELERLIIKGYGTYGIRKFKYDGHDYIMVKGTEQMAIEHDPNCSCHKENLW